MSSVDRIVRLLVAVVFAVLYLTEQVTGTFGIILAAVAVIFGFTSALGFCPIYRLFKFSTRKAVPAA